MRQETTHESPPIHALSRRLPALLALVLLAFAPALAAQPPAGFYDTVDASDAATLRSGSTT